MKVTKQMVIDYLDSLISENKHKVECDPDCNGCRLSEIFAAPEVLNRLSFMVTTIIEIQGGNAIRMIVQAYVNGIQSGLDIAEAQILKELLDR